MTHDVKLGAVIDNPDAARDAVHFAIAPVTADTRLYAGQHVGLIGDGDKVGPVPHSIGIVDPFLVGHVNAGERFWLMLYQNTITSLRHAWTHPAFEGEGVGAEAPVSPGGAIVSRKWIENFAAEIDQTYNRLMDAADRWAERNQVEPMRLAAE